jgi:tetratricopeptide (TPR) repeat protein
MTRPQTPPRRIDPGVAARPGAGTPAAIVAGNRRRARLRRILLAIAVPVAVLALLLPLKIVSMYGFAHRSISAYLAGDAAGAAAAARGQAIGNGFEPYKAPYNLGDALALSGDLADAREAFERALPLAPGLEACAVHINLGITIERMGDQARQAGDEAGAQQLYGEALGAVADTPEPCRAEDADAHTPDPERSAGQSLDDLEERLRQKQQPPPPQPSPEPSDGEDRPSEGQLQDLEQKLQQGEGERRRQDEDGSLGPETDKPW